MTTQYIIALGSNLDSETAFAIAIKELQQLGEVLMSSIVIGKDFTGKTNRIYHNAVVFLVLCEPMTFNEFNFILKNIEKQCGRGDDKIKVPMDLDVLASYDGGWQVIRKRLPFKEHEKKGLQEVASFLLDDVTSI